ncbi:EF-hand calcium-binding domain-containing protein 5 [Eublepharis macularius]|uniref:EF-hand calcium-binding domain-containing protein 5 n=1 Tax=Eublepharis macularius TaxID=481883 RepID=A0AA97KN45_EUBMA|nr:EF-hand calcium-binding domain-containing protein 5 [Eublepharis macularius]
MAEEPEKPQDDPEMNAILDQSPETGKQTPQDSILQLCPRMDAQWKAVFFENVQRRALNLQNVKVGMLHKHKAQQEKVEKKVPPDGLSREWFDDEAMTLETRAYLLDKLLPTLVPGVEKLLKVAERKKVLEAEEDQPSKLDPINFLGEYLMRCNPAYHYFATLDPYVRGIKAVTEELKAQVPETMPNKLAQMKALVKEKRKQREQVEQIKRRVTAMRKKALTVQFTEWTLDTSQQIPLVLVQSALKSYMDIKTSTPTDGLYARTLEAVGTLEVKVNEEEFAEYILSYIKNFTSDMFQELLKHLLQCANDAREIIRHDMRRMIFLQLFLDCDHGKVGLLDRQRVLTLLENFYNSCSELARKGFRNPRQWPIIELDDIDLIEFWGDMEDDEQIPSERSSLQFKYSRLGLSEEALVLSQILQGILSEDLVAVPSEGDTIEEPVAVSPEVAVLEQQVSSAEEISKVVQARSSGEPAAEGQKDQDPTAVAESSAAIEVAFTEAMKVGLDPSEENSNGRPEGPAATSEQEATVMQGQASKENNLGSNEQMSSEEPETTAKTGIAESASILGEETTVPDEDTGAEVSQELQDESTGEQPVVGTESHISGPVKASESFEKAPQLIYGLPWSGDLQSADLTFKYSDYGKEVREDWSMENSRFSDLRMNMIDIQSRGPPSSTSAFDKHYLNLPQFVQLMETFIEEEISLLDLKKLVEFMKKGYVLLEKEKISQMEKVRHDAFLVRQQLLLASLFEKWDNECSGFLDMTEVDAVLSTFKEGMEQEALEKAKLQLPIPQWHPSGVVKLFQKDFQMYIDLVVSEFTGSEDEVLDNVAEFLMASVEKNHIERLRGSARRKWLRSIQHAAMTNGGHIDPVYRAVFKALSRDADAHGDSKKVSAYIALLEYNVVFPERGDILLHYVACTEDDAPYVLNQSLYMDMKGVSFAAALDDKPIHVPRVQLHGNIHFWNSDRPEQKRQGSFLVVPLEDIRRKVFGIFGLDTLRDRNEQTIFVPHEIRFYQGVAKAFSVAYHHIRTQDSIKQMILTAVGWLSSRAPSLHAITAYFMEPGEDRMHDYTLRKVMATNDKGHMEIFSHPAPVLNREDNIFRDYLFKCIDCAEVVAVCMYEDHHIAVPLRDPAGQAMVVFDVNLGQRQKLPSCEHKDLQKMLKMLQAAACEILKEDSGDLEPYYVLEAEYVGDWRRGGVLFYRFMLQDLQNCIWNLDPQHSFNEIKSYEEPPTLVHGILKCVLLILYPQWACTEEVENWNCCIQKLDGELIENICYFDPTAAYVQVRSEVLYRCLQGIHRTEVWKLGSAPVEYLYNWTLICLSLIELAKKLQRSQTMAPQSSRLLLSSQVKLRKVSESLGNVSQNISFT